MYFYSNYHFLAGRPKSRDYEPMCRRLSFQGNQFAMDVEAPVRCRAARKEWDFAYNLVQSWGSFYLDKNSVYTDNTGLLMNARTLKKYFPLLPFLY